MDKGQLSDCGTVRIIMAGVETGTVVWADVPCRWKGEGLAVVDVSGDVVIDGDAVEYRSGNGATWGVTHVASGRNIGPARGTPEEALAVALGLSQLGCDWTQDIDAVRAQVESNERAASFLWALYHGRVALVHAADA